MPRKRLDWIILTVVIAAAGVIWIGMTTVKASAIDSGGKPARAALGYPAPDFTLSTPDGGELTLSAYRGRPIILNFWATWCPPCRVETPAFVAAHNQWGDEIAIIGVNVQESPEVIPPFMTEFGINYPIAVDPDAEVARAYRVFSFPTTYFIDSSGTIIQIETGQLNEVLLDTRLADLAGR